MRPHSRIGAARARLSRLFCHTHRLKQEVDMPSRSEIKLTADLAKLDKETKQEKQRCRMALRVLS